MMSILSKGERRFQALKLAASMLRPRSAEDKPPTPEELIKYAEKLADWVYGETR